MSLGATYLTLNIIFAISNVVLMWHFIKVRKEGRATLQRIQELLAELREELVDDEIVDMFDEAIDQDKSVGVPVSKHLPKCSG